MKELQLPEGIDYYKHILRGFREMGIKHTYFSGLRVIAFENDEDATLFMLQYPATKGTAMEYFKKASTWKTR